MAVHKVKELLELQPHPEGGFYRETFRDTSISLSTSSLPAHYKVDRPISTAIYFLLPAGCISRLHRLPSSEVWHFYSGDPLTVLEIDEDGKMKQTVLGADVEHGQKPQHIVPPLVWFGAYPANDVTGVSEDGRTVVRATSIDPENSYSLVGCTVAPAFQFHDFEMAKRSHLLATYPHAQPYIEFLTDAD